MYEIIEVTDKEFIRKITLICKKFTNLELTSIGQLNKDNNRNLFILTFGMKKKVRFEYISNKYKKTIDLRKILESKDINVSKILYYIPEERILISEWIEGEEFINFNTNLYDYLFENFGEMIGKINSIVIDNLYLGNGDVNLSNIIITKTGDLFIIDHERLRLLTNDERLIILAKTLLKRINRKGGIDAFLKGYEKYFDTKDIRKLADEHNWIWWGKKKGVKK